MHRRQAMHRIPTRRTTRLAAVLLLPLLFAAGAAEAADDAWDGVVRVYDAAVLRPAGFLQTVLGAALLVSAYPLALLGESASLLFEEDAPAFGQGPIREATRVLVAEPYEYTFERELGDV